MVFNIKYHQKNPYGEENKIKLYNNGVYLIDNTDFIEDDKQIINEYKNKYGDIFSKENGKKGTMAYDILKEHNYSDNMDSLEIKFDSIISHDLSYVAILQTARAIGLEKFPVPYVLTNCHNSLCAVGGTLNEDDHMFALSAAKKYGGIYVPSNLAVLHSYNREMMAAPGKMIIGSDSHTRYGALGTLAMGEGGGEIVKQFFQRTYNIDYPEVVGIYLTGKPKSNIGPHDVALSIIKEVYKNNFTKNSVMEFIGDGIKNLSMGFRNGIDVMTTEANSLSSIWITDRIVENYLDIHNRKDEYKKIKPKNLAYYDRMVYVELDKIKPSIALPFHPSNVYTIDELNENPKDILNELQKDCNEITNANNMEKLDVFSFLHDGHIRVNQGIIAGCSGGIFENVMAASSILKDKSVGQDIFNLSIYPDSQPNYLELVRNGTAFNLMESGAIVKNAFCGPCFGAGDTPSDGALSIRHTTRNFPNREGSKPGEGQLSLVGLMDARSIAKTAVNGGILTPATEEDVESKEYEYRFNKKVYENRVYNGFNKPDEKEEIIKGPNIKDWPKMEKFNDNLLIKLVSYIDDDVTTTDELIPSGEFATLRSNPLMMAEYTLSRRDPKYVGEAKKVKEIEEERLNNKLENKEILEIIDFIKNNIDKDINESNITIGSSIYAKKPGDGSAREQATSSQKVLGAVANIANEYATIRYHSNLINWGMVPFLTKDAGKIKKGDYIYIPNLLNKLDNDKDFPSYIIRNGEYEEIVLSINDLNKEEREVLKAGSLINYYKK